jgi:mRNA interferase RelE/StbE
VHKIYLEKSAEKDLRKLPTSVFQRALIHLKALSVDPRPPGCHKITGSKKDWRIRIGDYRLIYEIDDQARTVKVMRVRHRREVYR